MLEEYIVSKYRQIWTSHDEVKFKNVSVFNWRDI